MLATLAIAIGATTAVFTVVDETLLRPAPFAFADRLVDVLDAHRVIGSGGSILTPEKIAGWQGSPLFERFEGYSPRQFDIIGDGEPERVFGLVVTTGLFPMLGVQPIAVRDESLRPVQLRRRQRAARGLSRCWPAGCRPGAPCASSRRSRCGSSDYMP